MTIGIDCRLYSPKYTGIGRYVFELVQHLIALDQENSYILYFNQEEYDAFNIPNERWQKRLINVRHYSLAEQWRYYRFLKQEPIDLMYFPHFNAPILYRDPFVVTIHDLTLHAFPYKEYQPRWSIKKQLQIWAYRLIMKSVVKHAKTIIAVSENTKSDLIREYPETAGKIVKILEGVPETFQKCSQQEIDALRAQYQISKPYLLYTGVWRSHKNLLTLIRAFHRLVEQGRDIQLVMTGKKDPAYPEIPALIEELGLKDRVILTGFVSDKELIALNSAARVFVFPSLYEGFGLPPLEAMQFGVPVACSNTSSLPEVCGDAALYFNPTSAEEMAQQINPLIDDENLRQTLIAKGKANLQRFSWSQMTRSILDVFNR